MSQELTEPQPDAWVTMQELAREIRVSVRTLYKWRAEGRAPRGAAFGKHVRMRRADVDAWIAARLDGAPAVSGELS